MSSTSPACTSPNSQPIAALRAMSLDASVVERMDYAELRAAIENFLPLKETQVVFNGKPWRWHKAAEPDRLLDEAVSTDSHSATEIDPFWAVAWRAAHGLDRYFDRLPLTDARVLELGCGSGGAGIAAALHGARVTLSDAVDLALLVARLNSWPVKSQMEYRKLRWADDQLDNSPFPWIIGSDLVYDPSHFPQLEACARRHLAPGGHLLLSEPNRHTGDRFATWITQAGWAVDIHQIDLADQRISIRIFDCHLPGS